jgi:hypothetical protein
MFVIGELRVVPAAEAAFPEERGGGGGCMRGATVDALRLCSVVVVSCSLKSGETGLGAVVDGACELLVELA